ncbi:MAG: TRL-like family protein [Planctomycetota bacterium]
MFKKIGLVLAAACLAGCASAWPNQPLPGFLFSDVTGPNTATGESVGSKSGMAECISVLGWVCTGDASMNAAAKAGGVKTISHVDTKTFSVLGIFARDQTIVYGS